MSHPNILTSHIAGARLPVVGDQIAIRENPARTAETAARWQPIGADEANRAMEAAAEAFPVWAAVPNLRRIELVEQLLSAIEKSTLDFARVITRENGKPLHDSHAEVAAALRDAQHFVEEAYCTGFTETMSPPDAPVRSYQILEPLGVCLLITPWNFPLATIVRKLVPALLYGNSVVVKSSEFTPGTASLLFSVIEKVDFPPGVAQLVLGYGREIGATLAGHPALRAISFTGSNATGAVLSKITAGRDVRLQLEMGGNNSLVVLADADLEAAVEAAAVGGFTCAGQWCTGTGRVIVEEKLHAEFVERLANRAAGLRLGPGEEDGTEIGPVINKAQADFANSTIAEAVAAGARAHGGATVPDGGHFVAPTVLSEVTESMAAFTEELFVPVLPVIAAADVEDALRLANSGDRGLSASLFSQDIEKAANLARRIEAGIAHVNLHTAYREPELPVAGWRESGRGIPECGRFARDFFSRPRALYIRNS